MTLSKPAWFYELSWTEVEDAIKDSGNIAILPVGNLEPWGDFPVGGDNYQMMGHLKRIIELAKEDKAIKQIVVMPPIWYGYGPYWEHYPGTASIRFEVLREFYKDIAESLLRHGVTKILWISGHSGNIPVIYDVGRQLKDKYGTVSALERIWVMEWEVEGRRWASFGGEVKKPEDNQRGHGGRHCTPIPEILATSPELIERFKSKLQPVPRPKRILTWGSDGLVNPTWDEDVSGLTAELKGFNTPDGRPSKVSLIGHWEDIYPYTAVGDPRPCIEKEGIEEAERAIDYAARHSIALIKELMKINVPARARPINKVEEVLKQPEMKQ